MVAPHREGCVPVSQAPDARAVGDTVQNPVLPSGQAEAGRAQDSEDTPAAGHPRVVQTSASYPRSIQASTEWETVVVTMGADSRAGELNAATVVPPCVTLCLGGSGCQVTEASQDKQLP